MAQQLPPDAHEVFGCHPQDRRPAGRARLAWCCGDPGAAASLQVAARRMGDGALEREALAMALRTLHRPVRAAGVLDAGLCHGAAGLVQVYNRLWQSTREEAFAAGARRWLSEVLRMDAAGQLGGYPARKTLEPGDPESHGGEVAGSFLTGPTGIGLALLAAVTDVEPAWDRLLVSSLAPSTLSRSAGPRIRGIAARSDRIGSDCWRGGETVRVTEAL
jgi:hypothetical protein